VPLISLAGGYKMLQLVRAGEMDQSWSVLAIAVLLSAASAWACIHFFMAWIAKSSLMPFVAYRLILGVLLLLLFT
jgi:undecaprenyl-diphosphatase